MASKLEVLEEREANILTLVPVGRVDSSNAPLFERVLKDWIDDGETNIIVDFSKLSFISSSGMRVLLIGAKSVRAISGKLVLCGMRDSIREIFSISGFDTIIPVVKDRITAADAI
ncbi:MAG: STAS domain-containing protein [Bacteroidetes bacterium]|nr:STAS domain-containing protein [Bacteroidota bacterium]